MGRKRDFCRDSHIVQKYHPRKGAKTRTRLCDNVACVYHPRKGAKTRWSPCLCGTCRYHPRKRAKTWSSARKYSQALYRPMSSLGQHFSQINLKKKQKNKPYKAFSRYRTDLSLVGLNSLHYMFFLRPPAERCFPSLS